MPIDPWELAFVLLLAAIVLAVARVAQIFGAVGRARSAPRQASVAPAVVTVTAPPVICAACQTPNPENNRFCSECGATLTPAAVEDAISTAAQVTCPSCATLNPPGQAFCGQCGTRLSVAA